MKPDLCIKTSIIFVIILSIFNVTWAQEYTPDSLLITLFADGKALIEYRLSTDVTVPTISISLFGTQFDQLIVVDEENLLLDNRIENSALVVDTFGASSVFITYTTSDLVNKTGRLWTFVIDSPIDASIKLPADSVIIGLNQIPNSIKLSGNQYLMIMPAGHMEISYVIGVLGTKEHASVAISDAEKIISDLKATGVIVAPAESKLSEAKSAFDGGKYSDAERLANDAKTLANDANQNAKLASAAMKNAETSIKQAKSQGFAVFSAEELLVKAGAEYTDGNYQNALSLAQQASAAAFEAMSTGARNTQTQTYILTGVIAASAAGAGGAAMYLRSRKRAAAEMVERMEHRVKERRVIDLEKIFTEKQYLRQEDRDTINFLAEKGGEAFESEIREKFNLPKTTVWRLVKRLAREELVEIKKAGGQNLIRIKEEYTRTDQSSAPTQ